MRCSSFAATALVPARPGRLALAAWGDLLLALADDFLLGVFLLTVFLPTVLLLTVFLLAAFLAVFFAAFLTVFFAVFVRRADFPAFRLLRGLVRPASSAFASCGVSSTAARDAPSMPIQKAISFSRSPLR